MPDNSCKLEFLVAIIDRENHTHKRNFKFLACEIFALMGDINWDASNVMMSR